MAMDRGRLQKKKYAPADVCRALALAGALLSAWVATAEAAERCTPAFGRVVSVQGHVEFQAAGAGWQATALNATLCAGDMVRVHQRSRAALLLSNETTLRLNQGTTLTLVAPGDKNTTLLEQISGGLHVITRTPKAFKVKTPFVNANVEGTEFAVRVTPGDASIAVYEGQVVADNDVGSVALASGEEAVGTKTAAPTKKKIVVRPMDAVAWTLYVPTLFDYQLEAGTVGGSPAQLARQRSIALYRGGQLIDALAALDNVADSAVDARFLTYRAGLLLVVGRLDEAKPEIDKALSVDPKHGDAHALLAIVAVVENDKDRALDHARRAVGLEPTSPAARIALSYAQQARFEIAPAVTSAKEAVKLDPQSALANARLAELRMSTGDLDGALAAAQEAVRLNPNLGRTRTVLGFANLLRIDTSGAKASFERAIELDSADPLPRLGLGLAKIREGDLGSGRVEIEIAAILDPLNSLMRSYLGKAYYEEKRDQLAGTQFDLAKAFDAKDPTPWFYDAIRKQAENRQVEALRDLEQSIELNDNRAVYRSRLLLDQDLAARNSRLAGGFGELGFDQLVLAGAYRSAAIDLQDFYSHRLLADAFSNRPRHDTARVSESLQAQLWQPLDVAPIETQRIDEQPFFLSGTGPASPGLNEFNPLFVRQGVRGTASVVLGGNNTLGDQILVSGLYGRTSVSVGHFYYKTDGFQEGWGLKKQIQNASIQTQFFPDATVFAEVRRVRQTQGDSSQNFFGPPLSIRLIQDRDLFRAGFRAQLSSTLGIAAVVTRQDQNATTEFPTGTPAFTFDGKETSWELQIPYRGDQLRLLAGMGQYRSPAVSDFLGFGTSSSVLKSSNEYIYAQFDAVPGVLTFDLGISHDSVTAVDFSQRQSRLSPKLGLLYRPLPNTAVRLATFRTMQRSLLAQQTIEPTQIVGFNQFFDDSIATKTKRTGIGLDQKLSRSAYVGVEFSHRRLTIPQSFTDPLERFTWKERDYRGYFYWLPTSSTSAWLEYTYERITEHPLFAESFVDARTHKLPLGMKFFRHEVGDSLKFMATAVRQTGEFRTDPLGIDFAPGTSSFWIVDLAYSIKLPHRLGLLSFELRNALDRHYSFQETDIVTPTLARRRLAFARFTVSF
jgi:tetratricopeptide (TPR) repeat protein